MGSYGYKYKLQLMSQGIKDLKTYKIKNQEQTTHKLYNYPSKKNAR